MKEVISQSEWVGKVITCKTCNRSYQIEAGDVIQTGYTSSKLGSLPKRFDLPCGHYWALPPRVPPPPL